MWGSTGDTLPLAPKQAKPQINAHAGPVASDVRKIDHDHRRHCGMDAPATPCAALALPIQVAHQIRSEWGPEYTYKNKNGNWAINPDILAEFRKLTEDTAVWKRSTQAWRLRQPKDGPGRMIK
jgi:hypothetical protein